MPQLFQYVLAVFAFPQIVVAQHDIYVIVGTVLDGGRGVSNQFNLVGTTTAEHLPHG